MDSTMARIQQSTGTVPIIKPTTLYVLAAFNRNDDGELVPAFEAQQMPSGHSAISRAKLLAKAYAGVIAWQRGARPDEGEFGPPEILFQAGDLPDLE